MDTWANSTDLEHFPGKLRNLAGFLATKPGPQNGAADELRSEAMMQRRPSLKKLKRQILGRNAVMAVQSGVLVADWKATRNITHIYIYIYTSISQECFYLVDETGV